MDFTALRQRMVESQLRTNRVTDETLLAAIHAVPRELFVPRALRSVAYVDDDIEVAPGRYLMEPMVFARLAQLAEIEPTDLLLDIGCSTGYSATVLARVANGVVAVESNPDLAQRATELLRELEVANASVFQGQLDAGHPSQAPYDVIFLDGAAAEVSPAIISQLAEGGRLVAVLTGTGVGRGTIMTKTGGQVSSRPVFDAAVRPLPGFAGKPRFVF